MPVTVKAQLILCFSQAPRWQCRFLVFIEFVPFAECPKLTIREGERLESQRILIGDPWQILIQFFNAWKTKSYGTTEKV